MSNDPSPDVIQHILEVMAEKEPKLPPKHAFTAKQYYAMLLKKLEKSGVPKEKYPKYDFVRRKLTSDESLEKTRYPRGGSTYFWQRGVSNPAKKDA